MDHDTKDLCDKILVLIKRQKKKYIGYLKNSLPTIEGLNGFGGGGVHMSDVGKNFITLSVVG